MRFTHTFEPVFNENSRILILGSFPSVKSREEGFYYGHPRNRFWKVLAEILDEPMPETVTDKQNMLLNHKIALWDVCSSCEITGSADSSIREVIPNDLSIILERARIEQIFTNGKTADDLYRRIQQNIFNIPAICLPSTSPANAAWSIQMLISEWKTIKEGIKNDQKPISYN